MRFVRRLYTLIRLRKLEAELAEEIAFHRAMKGSAAREMGNITLAREEARAVWLPPRLESVWQDLAYALRALRRQPGFALVAVGTLAIAIGLDTSVFTVFCATAL